jgi:hypothetical protein
VIITGELLEFRMIEIEFFADHDDDVIVPLVAKKILKKVRSNKAAGPEKNRCLHLHYPVQERSRGQIRPSPIAKPAQEEKQSLPISLAPAGAGSVYV